MLIKSKRLLKIQKPHTTVAVDIAETTRAAQLEIYKAKQEANLIKKEAENTLLESRKKLAEAEEKANEIIRETRIKAEEIKEKITKETLQLATDEANQLREQSIALLKELFEVKRQALIQAHKDIIKVALDLAEKIIKYQASIDQNLLKTQVIEAIKKATSDADRIQVYVNPSDIKILEQNVKEIEKLFPSGLDIVPLSNDSVEPGSCVVETKSGQLDANFSTQLNSLIGLMSHLELKEPEINLEKDFSKLADPKRKVHNYGEEQQKEEPSHEDELLAMEETLENIQEQQSTSFQKGEMLIDKSAMQSVEGTLSEEEILKQELLSEEPLINFLQEEENPPFTLDQKLAPDLSYEEVNQGEIQIKEEELEISSKVAEDIKEIVNPQVQDKSETGSQPSGQLGSGAYKKKKLITGNFFQRTKEELDELDESSIKDEESYDEEGKTPTSILKPKKPTATKSQISNIASELEENPTWKDYFENENDEE